MSGFLAAAMMRCTSFPSQALCRRPSASFVERSGIRLHFAAVNRQAGRSSFSRTAVLNEAVTIPGQLDRRARRRHADDGAVYRDQGGKPGLPAILSHGRFLRAVLRRCRTRLAGARHRAHQARQAPGPRHSDVRRAGACRRRLSAEADRRRFPRRRLRAAGRSGRGAEARLEIGGQARRYPPGDAGNASPKTGCSPRPNRIS